ncbi:unnamed protein product [Paramecium pentaurelia]|uniref:Peptidase A1 domain-containing protein n=1 Tax=Paramecium pentaurelia TaxID=43138 RepID=A0A8S1Y9H8_9CILI|nr:unnamed protein product [Paramecium pentaurelia]
MIFNFLIFYSAYGVSISLFRKQNLEVTNASNFEDLIFYGFVEIGTPPQLFALQYDTGSDIMWVPSVKCENCKQTIKFSPNDSETLIQTKRPLTIQYPSSSVSGWIVEDYVGLLGSNIHSFIPFLLVQNQQHFEYDIIQGVMGLDNQISVQNIFDIAYQQGLINNSIFVLQLNQEPYQSRIYYNVTQQKIYNGTFWINSISNHYWEITVNSVQIRDEVINLNKYNCAVLDSGSSCLYLTDEVYNTILNSLLIVCKKTLMIIECPCHPNEYEEQFLPDIIINSNGKKFTISYKSYILQVSEYNDYCQISLRSIKRFGDLFDCMIFGDPFLFNYITIYDKQNNRIGFQNSSLEIWDITPQIIDEYKIQITGLTWFSITAYFLILGVLFYYNIEILKAEDQESSNQDKQRVDNQQTFVQKQQQIQQQF